MNRASSSHSSVSTDQSVLPVLVLQHTLEDGPGYLGEWLDTHVVPWQVFNTEAGQDYPDSTEGYGAMAILGGAPSANDPLPSLRKAERLIRDADQRGVPIIGHCLGGQLMARAFGGRVIQAQTPEIGWHGITFADHPLVHAWFGKVEQAVVYQWHYDTFVDLPLGATLLAGSPGCAHQAFAIGPHLAMQFHIEITPRKIADWLAHPGEGYPRALAAGAPWVQSPEQMLACGANTQGPSQALADHIYQTWRQRWRNETTRPNPHGLELKT